MKILLTISLLVSFIIGQSQQIEISVTDDENSEPIPYVHVYTESLQDGSKNYQATNKKGKLIIEIKEKTFISLSYLGYETIIDTIVPGIHIKEYKLLKTGFDIDEVVVTGQYKPVAVDKSIYDIKLIGRTDIENKAANNLTELLSDELNIRLSHDPSIGTKMKIRGISGANVKILIDGVPVIGRMDGDIDLSQIDLSNVDHIEFIEGPMSVIYGSNALAGVINIITKEDKYSKYKAGLNTYYESIGTYNANGNISFNIKKNSVMLSGGRNFFTGFDTDTSDRRMEYKPKEHYNAGLKYIINGTKLNLKYNGFYFKERLLDRGNVIYGLEPFVGYTATGFDTWFNTLRVNNNLRINHQLTKQMNFNILAAYSYYNRKRYLYEKDMTNLDTFLTDNPEDHDTTRFDAIIARGVYNYASKNNKININAGFDFNLEYGTGKRMKGGKEDIQDYAFFTGLKWNITPGFIVQPGLRASYNTKYNSPIVPSFNIKYNINKFGIRASYARGFRAPSLKELYLNFYDTNHQIEGNDSLVAEYAHNFNLSGTYNFGTRKNKFEIGIKPYYNIIENKIYLVQVDTINDLHYKNINIGHFESIGGDINLQYKYLPYLKIDAAYAIIGVTDSYDEETFIFSNSFNTKLTFNFLKNSASLSVFYRFNGEYPRNRLVFDEEANESVLQLFTMEAYHNMDITVLKKFFNNTLVLSGGAKNIFNNINVMGAFEGSSHGDSGGVPSLVGWGRTFFVSLKINITKY